MAGLCVLLTASVQILPFPLWILTFGDLGLRLVNFKSCRSEKLFSQHLSSSLYLASLISYFLSIQSDLKDLRTNLSTCLWTQFSSLLRSFSKVLLVNLFIFSFLSGHIPFLFVLLFQLRSSEYNQKIIQKKSHKIFCWKVSDRVSKKASKLFLSYSEMSFHRNKSLRNLRTNGRLHETFYADVPNQSTLIPSNIGTYNSSTSGDFYVNVNFLFRNGAHSEHWYGLSNGGFQWKKK